MHTRSPRSHRPQANILIIVVLMLFLSGLYGILVTKNVGAVLRETKEIIFYHKAYYMANAGIELGLTKIANHHFGFEDSVKFSSKTNTDNFTNGRFSYTMKGSHDMLQSMGAETYDSQYDTSNKDCTKHIKLNKGQGVIVPLSIDPHSTLSEAHLVRPSTPKIKTVAEFRNKMHIVAPSSNTKKLLASLVSKELLGKTETLGFVIPDLIQSDISHNTERSLKNVFKKLYENNALRRELEKDPYLIIASEYNDQQVCIQHRETSGSDIFPMPIAVIDSHGQFGDKVVSLSIQRDTSIPDYLIYTVLGS